MRPAPSFEPLPHTLEAMAELEAIDDRDAEWLHDVLWRADDAHRLVPDLVGVSLARPRSGLTFTVVANEEVISVLRAIRSAPEEPTAEESGATPAQPRPDDVLDERRWRRMAETTAAPAVRCTLTLPILAADGTVRWTVTLYAGSGRAFDDLRHELADLYGAFADGAVTNADLPFHSRTEARRTPALLREQVAIDMAVGILAAQLDIDTATARRYLETAAAQTGRTLGGEAAEIVASHLPPESDEDHPS